MPSLRSQPGGSGDLYQSAIKHNNTMGQFKKDYDRIETVKGNDAFLVEDSLDGKVKYATPSQINAMFSKFVADIETAVEKAAVASTKAAAAAASAEAAAASKTESVEAKAAAAASAAAAAASAAEANAALASAVKKAGDDMRTLAEALTLKRLMSGRLTVPHLSVDKLDVWKENNIVQKGMGAPKTIPLDAGRLYVDVENDVLYKSKNNSTVGDWSNK